mmetsp:Transcript_28284/g.51653  ORF Transcript_28284/g.51653 Transcript_28284/m.51653 type:complete len:132 (-) Transcript_28284:32-427(-)
MCTAGKGVGVEVSCTGASATSKFSSCDGTWSPAIHLCTDADVKAASRTSSGALQELTALSEGEQFVPLVFASGTWLPICGPYFEDDEGGAVLVCKKLGFESGTLHVTDEKFESDAAFVGRVRTLTFTQVSA